MCAQVNITTVSKSILEKEQNIDHNIATNLVFCVTYAAAVTQEIQNEMSARK